MSGNTDDDHEEARQQYIRGRGDAAMRNEIADLINGYVLQRRTSEPQVGKRMTSLLCTIDGK